MFASTFGVCFSHFRIPSLVSVRCSVCLLLLLSFPCPGWLAFSANYTTFGQMRIRHARIAILISQQQRSGSLYLLYCSPCCALPLPLAWWNHHSHLRDQNREIHVTQTVSSSHVLPYAATSRHHHEILTERHRETAVWWLTSLRYDV